MLPMTFHERKKERTEQYFKYEYGWILERCIACNGSGYYDNNGSPKCSCCSGTGKTRTKGPKSMNKFDHLRAKLAHCLGVSQTEIIKAIGIVPTSKLEELYLRTVKGEFVFKEGMIVEQEIKDTK